jgi:hypothetical protein
MNTATGPIEAVAWPERLRAYVVTPGASPRVHGYSVEEDLALHYRFSDLVYLSVTGSLPTATASAAFEALLLFLAPISIAEAPAHAAALVRMCGGTSSAVVGAAAIGVAEQSRHTLEEHASLFAWREGRAARPAHLVTTDAAERESVARLDEVLRRCGVALPREALDLTRSAAILVALIELGARTPEQVMQVMSVARLALAAAEAFAVKPGDFTAYPMRLPDFELQRDRS